MKTWTDTQRGTHVTTEVEIGCSCKPKNDNNQQPPPEARKSKISPYRFRREHGSNSLILALGGFSLLNQGSYEILQLIPS